MLFCFVLRMYLNLFIHHYHLYCPDICRKHDVKSLSPSLISGLCDVSSFNQPPIPLRMDTPQSPQLPHQSPSPPDYSPTEVGPGDRAGPLKASTSLEPFSCPLLCHRVPSE